MTEIKFLNGDVVIKVYHDSVEVTDIPNQWTKVFEMEDVTAFALSLGGYVDSTSTPKNIAQFAYNLAIH